MPNDKSLPKPENVAQQETGGDCVSRLVVHLPELWEEMAPGKVWARATKNVGGENMGLKCELKLIGGKFRWMTLHPQKFGAADTLEQAIAEVESFLHNAIGDAPGAKGDANE